MQNTFPILLEQLELAGCIKDPTQYPTTAGKLLAQERFFCWDFNLYVRSSGTLENEDRAQDVCTVAYLQVEVARKLHPGSSVLKNFARNQWAVMIASFHYDTSRKKYFLVAHCTSVYELP